MLTRDQAAQLEHAAAAVVTTWGQQVGRLRQIYVDADSGVPVWASVDLDLDLDPAAGRGSGETLVPLEDAALVGTELHVTYHAATLRAAPKVGDGMNMWLEEENELFDHYGLARLHQP